MDTSVVYLRELLHLFIHNYIAETEKKYHFVSHFINPTNVKYECSFFCLVFFCFQFNCMEILKKTNLSYNENMQMNKLSNFHQVLFLGL